jgi:cytochrome c-type biogenesis protein CcmH
LKRISDGMERNVRDTLRIGTLSALLALASLAPVGGSATPSVEQVEEDAQRIFETTLSPFCPGRLIQDCPTTAAGKLKQSVRERLAQGESKDSILADLEKKYQSDLSALPRDDSMGMLAWIMPVLFLIGGALVVTRWFARRSGGERAAPHISTDIDPEVARRIEREIDRGE